MCATNISPFWQVLEKSENFKILYYLKHKRVLPLKQGHRFHFGCVIIVVASTQNANMASCLPTFPPYPILVQHWADIKCVKLLLCFFESTVPSLTSLYSNSIRPIQNLSRKVRRSVVLIKYATRLNHHASVALH